MSKKPVRLCGVSEKGGKLIDAAIAAGKRVQSETNNGTYVDVDAAYDAYSKALTTLARYVARLEKQT